MPIFKELMRNTFHKEERLKSRKMMELLFSKGKAKTNFPLKMQFMEAPEQIKFPAQAMFVVPKRSFKKSPDRNKLKRRMREAYRLNKQDLYATLQLKGKNMIIAFLFIGKKEEDFETIQRSVVSLIGKFK